MSIRVFICIMLFACCHAPMRAQALPMQFPPGRSGTRADRKPSDGASALPEKTRHRPAVSASPASLDASQLPDAPDPVAALQNVPVAQVVPATPAGVPVTIHAQQQEKRGDIYTLRGGVEIDYRSYVIRADQISYDAATGEITATGHLQVTGGPDQERIAASHGTINLNSETGRFYDVQASVGVQHRGSQTLYTTTNPLLIAGKELIKSGPDNYAIIGGSMTSCRIPKPHWQIFAPRIQVDDGTGKAWNANFRLLGYPILYLPYVTHAVNASSGRQSGFLLPSLETSSKIKGTVVGDQYYWAINRSADLTLGLQYYSLRGIEQNAEFRYRGRGNDFVHARYNGLEDRGLAPDYVDQGGQDTILVGRHDFTRYTRAITSAEYLSSYSYRQVFAENFALAVSSEVKSWAFLTHEQDGLAGSFDLERYQNFASDISGDQIRILHLPRMEFDAADHRLGRFGVLAGGEASFGFLSRSEPGYRSHNVGRLDVFPHFSFPWMADGWSFRPTVGLRETYYSHSQNLGPLSTLSYLEPPLPGEPVDAPLTRDASLNRKAIEADIQVLPPVLERDFSGPFLSRHFGVKLRHTIEPEVNYRYVAGINKFNQVPRFDAIDIYSDTNEVEYGVTQRLFVKKLHPGPCSRADQKRSGQDCGPDSREWLSWFVGQKYFVDPNFGGAVIPGRRNIFTATLDFSGIAYITSPRSVSPIVSRLRAETSANTDVEWDFDYDTKAGRVAASDVFANYRHGNFFSGFGHALLNAVGETPVPPNYPPNFVNYNQMQLLVGYGGLTKPGLSAAAKSNLDWNGRTIDYLGVQTTYNFDCCGFTIEVQHFALGAIRNETPISFSVTLAGVAAAGSLKRAERLF